VKFLTDSQTLAPFSDDLVSIGWDVRTVYEEGVSEEKLDAVLVGYARALDRVFVSFDQLTGASGAQVAAEMSMRGGKVIQIRKGPEQPLYRALGRLLFNHPDWYPFLTAGDGMVTVHDNRQAPGLQTPAEYSQSITQTYRHHFAEYQQRWRNRQKAPMKRRIRKKRPRDMQSFI
jgi:hypothetical protein